MSSLSADTSLTSGESRWSDAVERRHHDARLMQMLLRITPMAALVDFGLGLLAAWLVYPVMGWGVHMVWPLGLSVVALGYAVDSVLHLGKPLDVLARPAVRWRFIGEASLVAVMFSGIAIFLFPVVGPDLRFLLGVMACGAIPVGAMSAAPVREVALAWTLTSSTGVLLGLLQLPPPVSDVAIGLLLTMDLLVLASVRSVSDGVRARLRAETAALRDRQSLDLLLRDFETQADDWLWETDAGGRLRHVSLPMARALGFDEGDRLLGTRLTEVLEVRTAVSALAERLREPKPFRKLDLALSAHHPQDKPRIWSLSGVPVFDSDGVPAGWRGLVRDVTLLREQARELHRLARTDVLTGLSNRHVLQQRCTEAVSRCTSIDWPDRGPVALAPLTLCLLDLDNFKAVNDTLGHAVGDRLLQEIARRLTACVATWPQPQAVVLARLGGDEFALLIDHALTPAARDGLVAALLAALQPAWVVESLRVEVRASIGVASCAGPNLDADRLFQNADLALYEAKDGGRNRFCVFDAAMRGRMNRRAGIVRDIGLLLAAPGATHATAGRLAVHYQPQVRLIDGRLVGAEALLRWQHPRHGWIEPGEFIPIVEETGLIVPLGEWVLRQACAEATGWPSSVRLAVNLSAAQLGRLGLEAMVTTVLADSGLPAPRLELEITETALMHDPDRALACVQSLRALGVGIALDDFGTGYSSLAQLATLPVDTLKIDRSFVAALGREGGGQAEAIVRLIVQLARTMGMHTLAEGVETDRQRAVLRACGCEMVQGFFCSAAVEPQALRVLLAQRGQGVWPESAVSDLA
ncbi:EAL domain-containing protein [Sphaerotilus montanus]|uniref:Diguanylate cyclase (GGDEF)-like protein n=1 Tax=Sphaerotilus montanus TaxID=522889 RepID=A0A7Y9U679_9BURK|nr:EAL domain-containing protein [Sphaerotilus montanus]NYG32336.1 diguanylate cyclase (GGDEF)-like protein [Sphaerotilus montanus]NZD56168.1 EAL domain-containing protein [Sphaerotilus montanus]